MIIIDKWAGLVTNASPYAIPPGAAVTQVNVQVLSPGQVQVRPGVVNLAWGTHSGSTSPIVSAFRFQNSTTENVVYQNASGHIYVARDPLTAARPGAITAFTASASTSPDRIVLEWTLPANGGASLTGLTVSYGTNAAANMYGLSGITAGATGATLAATSQSAGATYSFRIRARNEVGYGEWSDIVSAVMPKGGCTDPEAGNYDSTATYDDGSCA